MTAQPTDADRRTPRTLLQAGAIVLAGLWAYWPALGGPFVWDDLAEIPQNPILRDPDGLLKIWAGRAGPDYFPLKTSLQWLLWRVWQADASCYHLLNLGLHLLAALLFWRLLSRLGVRLGWLGGLLFAVHPLAVESAAWIAEFKNTLSEAFYLAAFTAYIDWDAASGPAVRRRKYLFSLGLFLLALLSKSSVVMLPAVLLLFAWWRRGTLRRQDVRAAAPFFGLSLCLGLVTALFQYRRALALWTIPIHGAAAHLAVAGAAAGFYLEKSLLPLDLHPMYRPWDVNPPSPLLFLPWLGFALLLGWFWARRGGWGRHALFGLGFFLINLLPVLGFVPMSYMHIGWVADHFAYLSLLGVVGLAAAALGRLWARAGASRWAVVAGTAALAGALAAASHSDAAAFGGERQLWARVLARNPDAWMAHIDLGRYEAATGDLPGAIAHYDQALRIRSDLPEAYYNRGSARMRLGQLPAAIADFDQTLRLQPQSPDALNNLGNALARSGRTTEAVACYERALRIQPGAADVRANLIRVLTGRLRDALKAHRFAASAHRREEAERNLSEAYAACQEIVRLDPDNVEAQSDLGTLCVYQGRLQDAVAHFEVVLRLRPDDEATRANLAIVQGALREQAR